MIRRAVRVVRTATQLLRQGNQELIGVDLFQPARRLRLRLRVRIVASLRLFSRLVDCNSQLFRYGGRALGGECVRRAHV